MGGGVMPGLDNIDKNTFRKKNRNIHLKKSTVKNIVFNERKIGMLFEEMAGVDT